MTNTKTAAPSAYDIYEATLRKLRRAYPKAKARLVAHIAACISSARDEGYTGTDRNYELTREDCEFIIEELGRKPTRKEWAAAGRPGIGDAHVAD